MLRASLLVLVLVLVGGGCAGSPATNTAPTTPTVVAKVADAPVTDAPASATTTTAASAENDTLYFFVEGGSIRLTKSAAGLTPEVAAALVPTEITEARESVELRGPHGAAYQVDLSTAGKMDLEALDPARGRSAAIGGIMIEATHVGLTFAREDVAPVALTLWQPCAVGLQGIDLASTLRSAERQLTRDFETRAFVFDDAAAPDIALRWAGEQGHDVLTAPPEGKLEPTTTSWKITVLDLRPRGFVVHCARRHAP